jgi:serine/threonine protein kinase
MPEHEPIPGDSERGQPLDPEYADPMPSMSIPSAKPAAIPPAGLPEQLGAYRIVRLIGIGGMGAVYEAQQASPHRTVALKVLRPGLAMESMLQRFKREAEILGRLQHVGIAQIYEANSVSTPQGDVPFFAMELIRGLPLNEYVHRNLLPARDCLVLLAKICDAVHYAHEMGVIHRDLKPGNILVDASGQPKVLDFGVARITDCDIQATTLQTTTGQIIGTLQYMAPEQAAGNQAALDTRCDVYALGIIAYELLVGQAPYDLSRLAIQEAVRIICEEEPTRISSINRSLRGDIETIIAKALAKEKDRRYQSALELAADIRRYLSDEPILARPPSAAYQLAKFARRNRTLVGGIAAVFLVLVLGVIGTSLGMLRARSHQAIAEKERDRATNSEQNVRRLLAASYADAAELARQRGQWQSALSNYNQAIAADTEGDMRLRIGLGKAEVLEALRRTKEAYDEVRWVAEHDVSQRYRAQILLLRGLLPHLFKTEDPNSLLREAISAGLQPADEALA